LRPVGIHTLDQFRVPFAIGSDDLAVADLESGKDAPHRGDACGHVLRELRRRQVAAAGITVSEEERLIHVNVAQLAAIAADLLENQLEFPRIAVGFACRGATRRRAFRGSNQRPVLQRKFEMTPLHVLDDGLQVVVTRMLDVARDQLRHLGVCSDRAPGSLRLPLIGVVQAGPFPLSNPVNAMQRQRVDPDLSGRLAVLRTCRRSDECRDDHCDEKQSTARHGPSPS
jgi:hypothetical protein